MGKKPEPIRKVEPNNLMSIEPTSGETLEEAMAKKILQPMLKNAAAASSFAEKLVDAQKELPGISDYTQFVEATANGAARGELELVSKTLAAQAITLDCMFSELARRAALNTGEYLNATERYGRLALKAQSNCRATLETLARLHQPREQIVRHVHVNEGGQAIVADQFHHHGGGQRNANITKQCHTTGMPCECAALLCQDA
ncbi:MAG: hypothetical protein JJ879_04115 [Sneathiella sp.]|nr:hypothetical protein [Sneathiella sp.]